MITPLLGVARCVFHSYSITTALSNSQHMHGPVPLYLDWQSGPQVEQVVCQWCMIRTCTLHKLENWVKCLLCNPSWSSKEIKHWPAFSCTWTPHWCLQVKWSNPLFNFWTVIQYSPKSQIQHWMNLSTHVSNESTGFHASCDSTEW
jgi:hypothetical protein